LGEEREIGAARVLLRQDFEAEKGDWAGRIITDNVPLGSTFWHGIGSIIHAIIPGVDVAKFAGLEGFASIKDWLMSIPQAAASRGISIGLTLGGIAMSLRIILGIERTYMS
jgi:hypothetical protein